MWLLMLQRAQHAMQICFRNLSSNWLVMNAVGTLKFLLA